jgi:hypothetical protein
MKKSFSKILFLDLHSKSKEGLSFINSAASLYKHLTLLPFWAYKNAGNNIKTSMYWPAVFI